MLKDIHEEIFIFSLRIKYQKMVSVELDGLHFSALLDTGNSLKDPLTGRSVLVVGAEIGESLTGLSREQFSRPVESVDALPGLRLIPYQAVGTNNGFLLAKKFSDVKIGSKQGSALVAFAPQRLSVDGEYQALTGGVL